MLDKHQQEQLMTVRGKLSKSREVAEKWNKQLLAQVKGEKYLYSLWVPVAVSNP